MPSIPLDDCTEQVIKSLLAGYKQRPDLCIPGFGSFRVRLYIYSVGPSDLAPLIFSTTSPSLLFPAATSMSAKSACLACR